MEIKVIKNLFTFQMSEKIFSDIFSQVTQLFDAYEPLTSFTSDDIKNSYKTNAEDTDFVKAVAERLPTIRAKGILISDETVARLTLKWVFIQQMTLIIGKLKKVVAKLEAANTIALGEAHSLSVLIQDTVRGAASQGIDGAETIFNEISENKTRAIRTAAVRKKTESVRKKTEKAALKIDKPIE